MPAERRSTYWGRCGVLLILCCTAPACTHPSDAPVSQRSDVLRIGFSEGDTGPDQGPAQLTRTLSIEGLTQVGADGRAAGRLAKEWDWVEDTRNPSNPTLRVVLRADVKFHNGARLDATAAAAALKRAIQLEDNLDQYPALRDIVEIKPIEDFVLQIHTRRASAFLPEDLEVPLTLPLAGTPTGFVGTGAYSVVSYDRKTRIVLQRFADYYRGPPEIREVIIEPFPTMRTAWAGLLRGEIDMVTNVPAEAIEFVKNDQVQTFVFPRRYMLTLTFNSQTGPLRSTVVRRALNMAVDRAAVIRNALDGAATPATGVFWPKHWALDTSQRAYPFSPDSAEKLLDEAGFRLRDDEEGQPPARLRFTCLMPEGYADFEKIGLAVQKQLYDIGVDMRFEVVSKETFQERLLAGRFEAVVIDLISGPGLTRPYIFWRSARQERNSFNVFGYENPEAERLFQALFTAPDEATIRSSARSLNQVFYDDPPAVFLAWQERTRAVRQEFRVIQEPGRDPVFTIWQWNTDNPRN